MARRPHVRLFQDGNSKPIEQVKSHPYVVNAAAAAARLAACGLINYYLARRAVQNNPPIGKFVEIEGVRLHYVERG